MPPRLAAHKAGVAATLEAGQAADTIEGLERIARAKREAGAAAASAGQAAPTLPLEERAPHVIMGVTPQFCKYRRGLKVGDWDFLL